MNKFERIGSPFASEKLLKGPPWNGCRVATTYHGYAIATDGVAVWGNKDEVEGLPGRRKRLQEGWNAGEAWKIDWEKAHPKEKPPHGFFQEAVPRIAKAMFPGLKPPDHAVGPFGGAWSKLDDGFAVSIALTLPSGLPPKSLMRTYVQNRKPVGHQVLLVETRTHDGVVEGLVIDPMAPQEKPTTLRELDLYQGTWVPKTDIREAATNVGAGSDAVYELYPIGGWRKMAEKLRPST